MVVVVVYDALTVGPAVRCELHAETKRCAVDGALQAPNNSETTAAIAAAAKAQPETHMCCKMTFLHPVNHSTTAG